MPDEGALETGDLTSDDLDKYVYFNGLNGATGGYLSPESERARIGERALSAPPLLTKPERDELKARTQPPQPHLGTEAENPEDLAEAGWGVVFAADDSQTADVIAALGALLALRREEAGANYREYTGGMGYVRGETAHRFLARHGVGPGPAVPGMVPYYLLIVGDPARIPFEFQHGLDVQYAVGRIFFNSLDEYRSYAASVVQASDGRLTRSARAAFFGVRNPGDAPTQLSSQHLTQPLADDLRQKALDQHLDWQIDVIPVGEAMKPRLLRLLGGDDTPAVLFTASHGAIFPPSEPERRRSDLGALVCGEWSNRPGRTAPLAPEVMVRAEDMDTNRDVAGLIAFHFACFGVGMPAGDSFAHLGSPSDVPIGPDPLLAPLPLKLLGHPQGGALAVIGHVDRALPSSFYWPDATAQKRQLAVFRSALWLLMRGHRLGYALEHLNQRYAQLSTLVNEALDARKSWKEVEINDETNKELAGLWLANNDARSYAVMGDPAVRVAIAQPMADSAEDRPSVRFRKASGAGRSFASAAVEMMPGEPARPVPSDRTARAVARESPPPGIAADVAPASDSGSDTVTISTWAARDVGSGEGAILKVRSCISPAGDVDTYLPMELTESDAAYVAAHRAVVGEAIAARLAAAKDAAAPSSQ